MKIFTVKLEALLQQEGQIYAKDQEEARRIAAVGIALTFPSEIIETKILTVKEYHT